MKKILFILFTVQFILIPRITGSYGANSIGNNHGHSVTNQGKKTIKKDIFGDTVIEDNRGNRKTIKKDIFTKSLWMKPMNIKIWIGMELFMWRI